MEVDEQGLAACWDYVAFPLTMMLDGLPQACLGESAGTATGAASELPVPALRSSRVAEALLSGWLHDQEELRSHQSKLAQSSACWVADV